MMLWDDVTTPWDAVTIYANGTRGWVVYARATWPNGKESKELIWGFTLAGVIDAIGQRGPSVGQVVWRTPPEWKAGE